MTKKEKLFRKELIKYLKKVALKCDLNTFTIKTDIETYDKYDDTGIDICIKVPIKEHILIKFTRDLISK